MKKTITLLLLLIVTVSGYSQFSKIHYIPPITATDFGGSTDIDKIQYIYISTPNTTPINVTITPIGGVGPLNAPRTIQVDNNTPYRYDILVDAAAANGSDSQLFIPKLNTGKVLNNKGYLIEAEDLIYANLRITSRVSTGSTPSSSQAGGLVAKGLSAYGKEFRIGGMLNKATMSNSNGPSMVNFASFIATENNTNVTITLPPAAIGIPMYHGPAYTAPINVTLNKNESYVIAIQNSSDTNFNSNVILGGLITSTKNIVVNSGAIAGNSYTPGITGDNTSWDGRGKDFGFDQIVPFDKTGKEYIFVKGKGSPALERILIIAHKDGTQVYKGGSATSTPAGTLVATLNAGQYYVFDGRDYPTTTGPPNISGTLFVTTTENVFAYQAIGGSNDAGNQNMFFVPPLNCATPSVVNNIPNIEKVGPVTYTPTVNIVTEAGASVSVRINGGTPIPLTGANATRTFVSGKANPAFVRYTYLPAPGNISVESTKQVYVSYYGSNNNATYGSYFSGFDTKPNISPVDRLEANSICNTTLKVTSAVATDQFQWLYSKFQDPLTATPIAGAITNTFTPTATVMGAGYYFVTKISACSNTTSDPIAVSACPEDTDLDGVFNNIDVDFDNDGITNTSESFGNLPIDLTNTSGGTLTAGTGSGAYSNTYTGTTTPVGTGSNTLTGNSTSFTTNLAAGLTNAITYDLSFPSKPISLELKYNSGGLINGAFEVKTGLNATITISNPTNQLLIDTNNDGIYESGVTKFSSFDIKFILNIPSGATPDFKIQTYLADSISLTHVNTSDNQTNSANFSIIATSVPKDSDTDGKNDQLDDDSDGDDIKDIEEGQSGNKTVTPFTDANKNGLADNFELPAIIAPVDTDSDLVPDYLDLDSDNDGILDSVETGTAGTDTNTNGIKNYRDLDSDGDTCFDASEAGFTDADADGVLGTSPVTVDAKGKVTGGDYTAPNGNYLVSGVPTITTQPTSTSDCATRAATVTIVANNVSTYKWEVSTDGGGTGGTWTPVVDGPTSPAPGAISYSGSSTNVLSIANALNGYIYRVGLSNAASVCKSLVSNEGTVSMSGSPVATDVTMEACDTDLDGMTIFDLTSKNAQISTNSANETFTYYTTQIGAETADASKLISSPAAYTNATPHAMDVWARVQNPATCFDVAKIALTIGVQIPSTYVFPTPPAPVCDDAVLGTDTDGISSFNLTTTKAAFDALFPSTGYTVTFYPTQADATNQTAAITNLSAYRNTIANTQPIWVRVNNSNVAFSTCTTLNTFFSLNVEALPVANVVTIPRQCDDNQDGKLSFNTTSLESTLLNGQTNKTVTYFDAANAPLKDANGVAITSPFPANFITSSQTIKAVVTNNTTQACFDETTIQFIVDPAPVVNDVVITVCDTDLDGFASFNLTSKNSSISANAANETFTYYTSQAEALAGGTSGLITSPYTNTTIHAMDVWARVVSANNCSSVAKVTLKVVVAFPAGYTVTPPPSPVCDDDRDGITTFDISATKTTMEALLPSTGYSIAYYRNQVDATNQANAITDLVNFRNNIPNTQQIWVRVNNTISPDCLYSAGPYLTVNVEAKPLAKATKELYKECDDNTDGQFTFTNTVDQEVRKGRTDVTVAYTDNATGVSLGNSFPTSFTTGNITVKAVVTNNTPQLCNDETLIVFQVDVRPVANPVLLAVTTECDNEADPMNQDGKFPFTNASAIQAEILGSQTGMIVKYTTQNGETYTNSLPNPFLSGTQIVTYIVENALNSNCTASGSIQFTVNPLPMIDLNADKKDDQVICIDQSGMTDLDAGLSATANPSDYNYSWALDGTPLAETSDKLLGITTPGVYTVNVSYKTTGCDATRTITVRASERAQFDLSKPFTVTDLADENTITVNLIAGLTGDYVYSLDDEIGYYQNSNVFTNVSPGTHSIYVKDKNGCGIVTEATVVIGVPKFFTPNNDGYNDYWNIKGVDNMGYTIFIYDRYGKLLKELIPESTQGWDGNFNLAPMPGSDYWYSLKLDNGREAKGHFSLKR